mmetsp:Transcript_36336/g.42156  ORF Transcript_36336/g.42156 Transcript_36336/m.42156 type:complete len:88 (-) Transcript_36336:73-336(-)
MIAFGVKKSSLRRTKDEDGTTMPTNTSNGSNMRFILLLLRICLYLEYWSRSFLRFSGWIHDSLVLITTSGDADCGICKIYHRHRLIG